VQNIPHTEYYLEPFKRRDHLENPEVKGKIILKWIIEKMVNKYEIFKP
jgi:hypothetical protein